MFAVCDPNLSLHLHGAHPQPSGYMQRFRRDGVYTLDLKEVNANLPVLVADASRGGQAQWIGPGGLSPQRVLVLGADADVIVDSEGLRETARFCGTDPVVLPGVCHDVMLDSERWQTGAVELHRWLAGLGSGQGQ